MKSYILVMADIHGNLSALEAVLRSVAEGGGALSGIVLLGDMVDYGPSSNQVIERIRSLKPAPMANIWGNHERAVVTQDYSGFSSERGSRCAMYTRSGLTAESLEYLESLSRAGKMEFAMGLKKCAAVHGSLEEPFWGTVTYENAGEEYAPFDWVFSGHSHIPHYFYKCYPARDERRRNRKTTVFLNPGSVGQPRNHNPRAHYALLEPDTQSVLMMAVDYDIEREMNKFTDQVDVFYKTRLIDGV